jgi:glyoxylase-like metal-dependent hydrolase (beta-lactamase superfamily II)
MSDVTTIDAHYLGQPAVAAAFLIVEGGRAAFVENNTAHAVPRLLQVLESRGLGPEQVEYAVVTHVHLDHAGGSSALMDACPNATLLAHPRAVRHLVDPSKLVASARQVYGEARFRELYGEIRPVAAERVRALDDGTSVRFGSRELHFFHTRGHANHHLCVHDSGSNGIFTGDAFGLAYPALQSRGTFAFPSTSPTDYLPGEASSVVRQIVSRAPDRVFLTHFGEHAAVSEIADQVLSDLAFSADLFEQARESKWTDRELERFCRTSLQRRFADRLSERGLPADDATWQFLELDLELNAEGIAYAAQKARRSA